MGAASPSSSCLNSALPSKDPPPSLLLIVVAITTDSIVCHVIEEYVLHILHMICMFAVLVRNHCTFDDGRKYISGIFFYLGTSGK